jgi:hypothetical protein
LATSSFIVVRWLSTDLQGAFFLVTSNRKKKAFLLVSPVKYRQVFLPQVFCQIPPLVSISVISILELIAVAKKGWDRFISLNQSGTKSRTEGGDNSNQPQWQTRELGDS